MVSYKVILWPILCDFRKKNFLLRFNSSQKWKPKFIWIFTPKLIVTQCWVLAPKFKYLRSSKLQNGTFWVILQIFDLGENFLRKYLPLMRWNKAWVNCTARDVSCLSKTICCCLDWLQSFAELLLLLLLFSHVINCQKTLLLRFYKEENLGYLLSLGYGTSIGLPSIR